MPNNSPIFIGGQRTNGIQFANAGAKLQCAWAAGPNGSRIHAMTLAQDDTTTGTMSLFRGRILTDNGRPYVGWSPQQSTLALTPVLAVTNTTNSTITRTNGSFFVDGWNVGMFLGILNAVDNCQNQVAPVHVTSLSATTLTFTSVVFNAAAASPCGGMLLVECEPLWGVAAVSGCGTGTTAAVNLLSTTVGTSLLSAPDGFITLGPNELLLASCGTLPTANKAITVLTSGGDY